MWTINKLNEKPTICNNNKNFLYIPILIKDDTVIFNMKWFSTQPLVYQKHMIEKFPKYIVQAFDLPHATIEECTLLLQFVNAHVQFFDFSRFSYLFDDVTIINMNDEEVNSLLTLCLLSNQNNHIPCGEEDIQHIYPTLLEKLENVLENSPPLFVKTSFKSSKHTGIYPCTTILDILNNLVHSSDVLKSLLRENVALIFRPWHKFHKNNEFRLFIFDGELRAISQTYPSLKIYIQDGQKMVDDILLWFNVLKEKMIAYGNYVNECVIDIHYDNPIHLIEINSGGVYSTCGSCLFDYTRPMPKYECRYVA
jgi:hypothetical protein